MSGWKTYLAAILIGVVGAAHALGWITEEVRNTLLVFLNGIVAATLRRSVNSVEKTATVAATNATIAAAASTETADKVAKAVKQ